MRILFFIGSIDQAGGTERVCSTVAAAFNAQPGHEVGIVSLYGGKKPFFDVPSAVALFYLFEAKFSFKYALPVVVRRLRKIVNDFDADVFINVNIDSALCLYSLPALWRMKVRNITWEHLDLDPHLPSRRLVRALAARWADAVVTLTERDVVNWRERFRLRAPVVTIPNPSPYAPRADIAYRDDALTVLAAGHLTYRKGFDMLIQAWEAIPAATRRGWRLRLVGAGEEREALGNLAATLGVSDTVDFAGQKREMEEEYKRAGLFVLSSRAEGLPMVLLEAMSFGLPVVAFDCKTGPAEIVVDGRTGLLAPPEDVHSLSHAMSRMMADTAFRAECARHALRRSRNYAVEPILRRWEDLFASLSPAKAERAA